MYLYGVIRQVVLLVVAISRQATESLTNYYFCIYARANIIGQNFWFARTNGLLKEQLRVEAEQIVVSLIVQKSGV